MKTAFLHLFYDVCIMGLEYGKVAVTAMTAYACRMMVVIKMVVTASTMEVKPYNMTQLLNSFFKTGIWGFTCKLISVLVNMNLKVESYWKDR